jgi:hypothetical protein
VRAVRAPGRPPPNGAAADGPTNRPADHPSAHPTSHPATQPPSQPANRQPTGRPPNRPPPPPGCGPIPWVVLSEILPPRIKGPAASLATAAGWLGNLAVTLSFDALLSRLGVGGVYLLYALLNCGAGWYVSRSLVETKMKTLQVVRAAHGRARGLAGMERASWGARRPVDARALARKRLRALFDGRQVQSCGSKGLSAGPAGAARPAPARPPPPPGPRPDGPSPKPLAHPVPDPTPKPLLQEIEDMLLLPQPPASPSEPLLRPRAAAAAQEAA